MANLSANTQSVVCVHDCSGNTVTLTPPSPVYNGLSGNTVTQLNMTVLGGENGLNV
jgi:hypothetical protein